MSASSSQSTPPNLPDDEPARSFTLADWLRRIFGAGAAATAGGMVSAAIAAKDLSPETIKALKDLGPPLLALLIVCWLFATYLKMQHEAQEKERSRNERRMVAMEANFQLALDKVLARHERTEGRVDGLDAKVNGLHARLDATGPTPKVG